MYEWEPPVEPQDEILTRTPEEARAEGCVFWLTIAITIAAGVFIIGLAIYSAVTAHG